MGTNRDRVWWWRLTPAARGIVAAGVVVALIAISAVGASIIWSDELAESSRAAAARYAKAQLDLSERQAEAAQDRVVSIERAYIDIDRAGIGTLDWVWRERLAKGYIRLVGSGIERARAIEMLRHDEEDERAHRRGSRSPLPH